MANKAIEVCEQLNVGAEPDDGTRTVFHAD